MYVFQNVRRRSVSCERRERRKRRSIERSSPNWRSKRNANDREKERSRSGSRQRLLQADQGDLKSQNVSTIFLICLRAVLQIQPVEMIQLYLVGRL